MVGFTRDATTRGRVFRKIRATREDHRFDFWQAAVEKCDLELRDARQATISVTCPVTGLRKLDSSPASRSRSARGCLVFGHQADLALGSLDWWGKVATAHELPAQQPGAAAVFIDQ